MPTPKDVDSPAYKKALKLQRKSQKTPSGDDIPRIRLQEKYFKARFPPPSLSETLDLCDDKQLEGPWKGSSSAFSTFDIGCKLPGKRAYGLSNMPGNFRNPSKCSLILIKIKGFVLLPAFIDQNSKGVS